MLDVSFPEEDYFLEFGLYVVSQFCAMLELFCCFLCFFIFWFLRSLSKYPNVKSEGGNAGSAVPEDFSKLEEIT